jgi:hypothetical protein
LVMGQQAGGSALLQGPYPGWTTRLRGYKLHPLLSLSGACGAG